MKSSARNQFIGEVKSIKVGSVNSEVVLKIGENEQIVATITSESVKSLNLKEGTHAYALIKASLVILARKELKTSSRNSFLGKVKNIIKGAVNSEVVLQLNGGKTITSIITNQSCDNLKIKIGDEFQALIKASHVILGVIG